MKLQFVIGGVFLLSHKKFFWGTQIHIGHRRKKVVGITKYQNMRVWYHVDKRVDFCALDFLSVFSFSILQNHWRITWFSKDLLDSKFCSWSFFFLSCLKSSWFNATMLKTLNLGTSKNPSIIPKSFTIWFLTH